MYERLEWSCIVIGCSYLVSILKHSPGPPACQSEVFNVKKYVSARLAILDRFASINLTYEAVDWKGSRDKKNGEQSGIRTHADYSTST